MTPTPQRIPSVGVSAELLESLGHLEGRIPANELALCVVRAALSLPDVVGARLWKLDQEGPDLWAEIGTPPDRTSSGPPATHAKDLPANVWTGALGSDDFRMRVLEVHGEREFNETAKSQLALLARFAALALALAERRGTMEELSSIVEATKRLNSTVSHLK